MHAQVGGSLDPELEELFDDLRDSGDLDLVPGKAKDKGRKGPGAQLLALTFGSARMHPKGSAESLGNSCRSA